MSLPSEPYPCLGLTVGRKPEEDPRHGLKGKVFSAISKLSLFFIASSRQLVHFIFLSPEASTISDGTNMYRAYAFSTSTKKVMMAEIDNQKTSSVRCVKDIKD